MRKQNILSFTRDETKKPSINRERHVNHQMAISIDSPKEFQFLHAKIEDILFLRPSDVANQQGNLLLGQKIWNKKELNGMARQPNLSSIQDKKVNESIQETEDRVIRQRQTKCRFNDKITNRTYELELNGRYLDQKCSFQDNYTLYSKQSFKLQTRMFEQFKNAQLLQTRGNQYDCFLQKPTYFNYTKQINHRSAKSKLNPLNKTDINVTLFDSPIQYQNELNRKIITSQILQSIQQQKRKRTISEY
ncbi:unnamed protein product (macronuclear) [Paramecium tetraurelia]|uniref:Uncharacterized protein n=1 Tax=Paramecium tetraurelia TaxID=5888 RepID=A0D9E6_PARTE|nr:uncharacterized protein GSPATT00014593001 [Paramecium tetraurelia]CAK79663.1 unnamed protein product [Paramecium tetraurelia]|eukprot:XP_001447060.1 hypothetical protein (macronuclear) [Paramecium tetraurelia strain d4-2]